MKFSRFHLFFIGVLLVFLKVNAKEGYPQSLPADRPFITTWKTDNPGASADNQIMIPSSKYLPSNYEVDWGDGTFDTGVSGSTTHTYAQPGEYVVKITGLFTNISFGDIGDKEKIISVDQWGDIKWKTMISAFDGCSNLDVLATDIPDFSGVSTVNNMFTRCTSLIGNSSFNNWKMDTITNMQNMFSGASLFNQPIDRWDVSNVKDMVGTFSWATQFNQPIGNWDVRNVTSMFIMFFAAESFNQDIGDWDVSKVASMDSMFDLAISFDQDLGKWNPVNLNKAPFMFSRAGLSTKNYDALLKGWATKNLKTDVKFHAGNSTYCSSSDMRKILIDVLNWEVKDAGLECTSQKPFITTWKTDNPGTSANNQITIPTFLGEIYNYTVNWGDGDIDTNVTGEITHTYSTAGTYEVSISGDFPQINFRDLGDKEKIISIVQWGDIEWKSMRSAFSGCTNLDVIASDSPNLSEVTIVNGMFSGCSSLIGNESFNNWDMGMIIEMEGMFAAASQFNQPIGKWDVSNVKDMTGTFSQATSFNQTIGNWNVGKVEEMWDMFGGATSFNQDIGDWDVSNVLDMCGMFLLAESFDQNLSKWNPTSLSSACYMFNYSSLSTANYDALLIGWSEHDLKTNVDFDADNSTYCAGEKARNKLINTYGWKINDKGYLGITITELTNQEHTDSYTLPKITGENLTGNEMYYTGPTGTGQSFSSGTTLYVSDFPDYPVTLYIYDFSGDSTSGCNDEKSFELTLNTICENPIADKLESALSCTSYTLPELSENNFYYTEANANGDKLMAGDVIYSSKTLYIYAGSENCYDENTFKITINASLCDIKIETIDPCLVQFPQFITPNGDGLFDVFKPKKNPCGQSGELHILDRYGRLVYATDDLYLGWDGTDNSRKLPETDYWYLFQNSDSGKTFTGHFTILR
ncbi:BspA family leucine-rich repeat surface protein [Zobellia amurskyensis]|uniref:BspA family leucine-rich repeat surface protein n=1 Tax=Zobellia amurskyensis TaxID=248905 RepID=A0A7X2ZUK3_9FLAO|nr:BspA family leucine-rich repeat surface protein [Zobellia amurskyensis]MUH36672.1 BspA family leucine-rich repeat surface protein [Zobellia amurskyensis]